MSRITIRPLSNHPGVAVAAHESVRVEPGGTAAAIARAYAHAPVAARSLEVEALLHLPRLAGRDGLVAGAPAAAEVERLSRRLQVLYEPAIQLVRPPRIAPRASDLRFDTADEVLAETVMTRFHYLHSARRASLHFASRTPEGRPAAVVSVSELDLGTLAGVLPFGIAPEETLVLSRVFAFDWAPQNTISHLLGQLERRIRAERPEIRLVLTYLNPNLGFDGASYRAANWFVLAHEIGTRYGYLGDDYVTDREIALLSELERRRVTYSVMRLAPLWIFARLVHRRDRRHEPARAVVPRPPTS
jgi:hypothetical protein